MSVFPFSFSHSQPVPGFLAVYTIMGVNTHLLTLHIAPIKGNTSNQCHLPINQMGTG